MCVYVGKLCCVRACFVLSPKWPDLANFPRRAKPSLVKWTLYSCQDTWIVLTAACIANVEYIYWNSCIRQVVTKVTVIASFLSKIIWTTRTHLSNCVGAGFGTLQILCNWIDFFLAVELGREKRRNTKLRNMKQPRKKCQKWNVRVFLMPFKRERWALALITLNGCKSFLLYGKYVKYSWSTRTATWKWII